MKKKKAKVNIILSLVVVILIIVGIIVLVNRNKKEENTTNNNEENYTKIDNYTIIKNGIITNNSEKLKEEKHVDEFTITDYTLTYDHGTKLVGTVKNNSSEDKNERTMVTIKFIDENGNELGFMIGSIPPVFANDTVQISSYSTEEIMNVYDVKVEANR